MKILAIDLGKYNSVACSFDTAINQSEFETIAIQRWAFERLLSQTKPDQIVIETSSITGWVHDFCQSVESLFTLGTLSKRHRGQPPMPNKLLSSTM